MFVCFPQQRFDYPESLLGTKYNTRFFYGWEAGLKKGVEVSEDEANKKGNLKMFKTQELEVGAWGPGRTMSWV